MLTGGGDAAHDELLAEQEAVLEQISGLTGEDESIEARHYVTAVNAMSLTLPWGIADQVEQLDGVARVYAAARFSPAESTQAVQTDEQTILPGHGECRDSLGPGVTTSGYSNCRHRHRLGFGASCL